MSLSGKPSLENLLESGAIELESLHPGGLTTTQELAELCHVNEKTTLLDVASGTGESACFLVDEFHCKATGLDASEILLEQAREKALQQGFDVEFRLGDAHDLPFDDQSFDVVISECTTCVLDKQRAIAEMVRVVKLGGYVGIHDICWQEDTPEKLKNRLGDIEDEYPETLAGWIDLFQEAGLENCKGIDRSGKMPDWMKSGRKKLGIKGQLKIARTVYNAWRLKGLLTIFESERIFSNKHTGYGIIVGQKTPI